MGGSFASRRLSSRAFRPDVLDEFWVVAVRMSTPWRRAAFLGRVERLGGRPQLVETGVGTPPGADAVPRAHIETGHARLRPWTRPREFRCAEVTPIRAPSRLTAEAAPQVSVRSSSAAITSDTRSQPLVRDVTMSFRLQRESSTERFGEAPTPDEPYSVPDSLASYDVFRFFIALRMRHDDVGVCRPSTLKQNRYVVGSQLLRRARPGDRVRSDVARSG